MIILLLDWTATDTDTDFEIDYVIPIIKISYDLYFDSQIYAKYTKSAEGPYYVYPHEKSPISGNENTNKDLKPEKANIFEFGYNSANLSVALFMKKNTMN